MPFSKRPWIFFVLSCSLLLADRLAAQDTDPVIGLADELFAQERFDHALKEYQRALFFNPGYRQAYVAGQIGNAWFERENYAKAAQYYEIAVNLEDRDSLRREFLFRKVLCQVLNEEYQFALMDLFGMPDDLSPYFNKRKNFYLGLCYFRLGDLDLAAGSFEAAMEQADPQKKAALRELLGGKNKYNRPNPNTAWYLSLVFPGTGQFYAGDIRNGLNSLVLNAFIVYIAYNTAVNYSLVDALVSIFPWLQRYWQGGFIRASEIARQKREENREELLMQVYSLFD